jgi:hypothetical protein
MKILSSNYTEDGGVYFSETLVASYKSALCHNPEDCDVNSYSPENHKSHGILSVGTSARVRDPWR